MMYPLGSVLLLMWMMLWLTMLMPAVDRLGPH